MTKSMSKKVAVAGLLVVLAVGTAAAETLFVRSDVVRGYDTDIWRVWVPAGESRVVVDGEGHTDLDLEVYDGDNDRLLVSDRDDTSYCIGRFYRARAGFVEIHIDNLGGAANAYMLSVRR